MTVEILHISEAAKIFRLSKSLGVEDVALACGASLRKFLAMERGDEAPTVYQADRWAAAVGLDVGSFYQWIVESRGLAR